MYEDNPKCPKCGRPLHRVTQSPTSPLNRHQFEAAKAGDWYCDNCPPNDRGHAPVRYFWNRELPQVHWRHAGGGAAACGKSDPERFVSNDAMRGLTCGLCIAVFNRPADMSVLR